MKKSIIISAFLFIQVVVNAQPGAGMWTWMNGDPMSFTPVYGTQGVYAPSNRPSYAPDPGFWNGKDGKFWLFGTGNMTDTWSFDPTINQWAWETGTHTGSASFGTMGVSSPSNRPPLLYAPVSWTDTIGNLWMFGGYESSFGPRNMLWKFNVTTKEWTWIRGSALPWAVGSYGVKGVSSPANDPASRHSSSGWVDVATNTLWLCLGEFNSGTATFFNDVWKYNISTNEWTWMAGESAGSGLTPVNDIYNALGAFDLLNTPAGKQSYNALSDNSGNGYISLYSDFWKYNITINQWACIRDDSMRYNAPTPFFCVPSYNYFSTPGYNNTLAAKDNCGNFWYREGNRLWHYNVALDRFTQVNATSGSVPVYGTLGVPDPANSPYTSRGAAAWIDNNGDFWQYGGTDLSPTNYYSIMWKYTNDTNCVNCSVNYNVFAVLGAGSNEQCAPAEVTFTNLSVNAVSYLWDFGDGSPTSSLVNPVHTYTAAGIYDVTLIAFNGTNTDTVIYYGIELYDSPIASFTTDVIIGTVILNVNTINTSTTGTDMDYWWNFGAGDPDEYAFNTNYDYLNPGTYTINLYVTDNNTGCSDTASSVITVFPLGTSIANIDADDNFEIYPNPFNENTTISYLLLNDSHIIIEIYNTIGQKVETIANEEQSAGEYKYIFSAKEKGYDAGIYFVKFSIDGKITMKKIVEVK